MEGCARDRGPEQGEESLTHFAPAPGVVTERTADALYVARLPAGPILVLDGTAALIWTTACTDAPGSVATRVAAYVDRDVAEIAPAVDEFLAELVSRGLLSATS